MGCGACDYKEFRGFFTRCLFFPFTMYLREFILANATICHVGTPADDLLALVFHVWQIGGLCYTKARKEMHFSRRLLVAHTRKH
jgi:hypothetical protein